MDEDEGGVACEEGLLPIVGIQGAVGLIEKRTLGLAQAILGNGRRSKKHSAQRYRTGMLFTVGLFCKDNR